MIYIVISNLNTGGIVTMPKKDASVNQITEGVIWKQLLIFFFPIMLGTLFQQLYNTADAVVVGRFVGTKALAAVGGSTGQITNLIVNFFVALASGATVIIARYYGAKNKKDLNDTLHTAAALSVVGGILTTIAGIALAPVLLKMMKTPADVMPDSVTYLRIYFAGIIFVFIYNVGSAILRAVGDSTRPLYFLIVCCFINIFLDILLVVGFNMGVAGAAIATVISQVVSAILIIHALMKSTDMYRLEPRKIRFHKFLLVSIITIGLPAGIQSIMYNISNIIIQTSLNDLGTDTMAAYTAFGKIDAIYWMISGAFSVSIITFIGQNYGAGKMQRVRKGYNAAMTLMVIWGLLCSLVLIVFPEFLFQIFIRETDVLDMGVSYLRILGVCQLCVCMEGCSTGAFNGLGETRIPSAVSIVFNLARIPMAILLPMTPLGLDGIWWALTISAILKGVVLTAWYLLYVHKRKLYEQDREIPAV